MVAVNAVFYIAGFFRFVLVIDINKKGKRHAKTAGYEGNGYA